MPYRIVIMPTYGTKQFQKFYSQEYETEEEAKAYRSIIEERIIKPFGNQLDCIMCWMEHRIEEDI